MQLPYKRVNEVAPNEWEVECQNKIEFLESQLCSDVGEWCKTLFLKGLSDIMENNQRFSNDFKEGRS